ncbi:MAG: M3 family metallopeptidase [Rubrivivax sp.]|nr:M3 family metallopeptidase [Rubrivivax sp.]
MKIDPTLPAAAGGGATSSAAAAANPLLQPWTAPHGLPPFAAIRPEHFEPALLEAMRVHRAELAAIAHESAPADFGNTVAAFDRSGALLDRVAATFGVLNASATSEALQAVQRVLAAPLAAHRNAVYMDAALFARVDALHGRRGSLGLDAQALRLLERVHLDFVRSGAQLQGAQQHRYAAVMEELAALTTRFAQNVLHDESSYVLPLPDAAATAGLPPFVLDAARRAAAERGLPGAVITLSRSLVVPFLTYSTRRDLREQAWRAWVGRGEHAGEHDNRELVRAILRLRREQAALMGCASYADHALVDTMAGSRAAVAALLDEVWPRALVAVQREEALLEEVRRAAAATGEPGAEGRLEPWDWRFWAERVRRERFAVDDAEVKPYFQLDNVVAAAFDCAQRLFGLRFTPRDDLPVYHPDVKAYEVHDGAGALVGLFLQDNFARATKRSGAWMSSLRWQRRNLAGAAAAVAGATHEGLPIILNNNNFARGEPTLLSLDDARTLFHEFGHGLHGLLSNVTYGRLSGTQVLRDFVELPSQIFEHWITEPEVLQRHARHHRTGEPIPAALVERLARARRFNQGYETVRYTGSAITDMAVHSLTEAEPPADLCAFEHELLVARGLPHAAGVNHRFVHFQHLFASSGYAAGYYVYLWAEVLDADGYDAFAEAGGPFDGAVARRLHQHIYSSGNSVDPGAAYRAFRGRDASVTPLLRKRGLLADEPA